MNRNLISGIALALAALSTSSAFADSVPLTRDQVRAELVEAQRTGDIVVVRGSSMQKLNEINPGSYPAKPVTVGLTREQVTAELVEAQRSGDIIEVHGSAMKRLNEIDPGNYPARS